MLTEDYEKEELTVNLPWANIFGVIILIPITLIYGIPYYLIWNEKVSTNSLDKALHNPDFNYFGSYSMVLVYIIGGIIIHELIHGLTWSIFAKKGIKSIKFGVIWKKLTPYCHCKEPLLIKNYIMGAIMPAIILGLIPALISIVIGHFGLLVFGIFFTMAACGDFLVINLLSKESMTDYVQDHPTKAGCFIYKKKSN